ncbi:MAG TPA: diiron oxygenase [Acidimicrobiales bacterium]|nr:diiron oxygenase [Acidimicrobiales bacterium]
MTTVPTAAEAAQSGEEAPDTGVQADDEAFRQLVARLSRQSVEKHFDAYADVDWDAEEYRIDRADPRWELHPGLDTLADTDWYRSLPAEKRAEIGLDLVASKMKLGLQFENILKRGLLEYAWRLPNGSPEFRYAYHEVIEEAQHSLMFQEFVNRSGFNPRGLRPAEMIGTGCIVSLGRRFPELFFFFVLGGEDPIDHVQRRSLRSSEPVHPLLERIMRIHVTEEARHLSFARHLLKRRVPELGRIRRGVLAVATPLILASMAQMMLTPSSQVVRKHGIPREVLREAYVDNPAHRAEARASLRKVRRLAEEVGLVGPVYRRLCGALGLSEPSGT